MGIRNLNRFIQSKCPDASARIHLKDLTGKKIAVDTSIYMYRYAGEGALLENMYLMASLFRHYNIHAVFVFDGIPPPQKTDIIELRRKKKEQAKKQYDTIAELVAQKKRESTSSDIDVTGIADLEESMRELRKQFARLRDCDITNVKELLVSFGFAIIDAEGEADVLCAKLSVKKRVYACLSDDTDMFVYGCPIVLRHISLLNHSVVSYDTADILKTLTITQQEFKMMCVVSGTDYTVRPTQSNAAASASLESVYQKLLKYKSLPYKDQRKYHDSGGGFYDWYIQHTTGTGTGASEPFEKSAITYLSNEAMFDTTTGTDQYKQLVILNRDNIHKQRIVEIMMKEDFIFIEPKPSDRKIIQTLISGNASLTSSPVYGVGAWDDTANVDVGVVVSPEEKQASIIANDVYGIHATSFQELQHKFRETTKPRRIGGGD